MMGMLELFVMPPVQKSDVQYHAMTGLQAWAI
jgi:hypothetical protein